MREFPGVFQDRGAGWGKRDTVPEMQAHQGGITNMTKKGPSTTTDMLKFIRHVSTKNSDMIDIMHRNGMVLDNLNDPMQKLAFTFFTEIANLSKMADNILVEHRQSKKRFR
jgi:hypothetical protein